MKVPFPFRIEPELLEALKKEAEKNGTDISKEIRRAVRLMLNCR